MGTKNERFNQGLKVSLKVAMTPAMLAEIKHLAEQMFRDKSNMTRYLIHLGLEQQRVKQNLLYLRQERMSQLPAEPTNPPKPPADVVILATRTVEMDEHAALKAYLKGER
jgi:hypothetical protein